MVDVGDPRMIKDQVLDEKVFYVNRALLKQYADASGDQNPIHQDEELSKLLTKLELGEQIPQQLYIVIAELIAFSYVLQGKFPENWHNIHQRIDIKS